jgi:hypothetical protein
MTPRDILLESWNLALTLCSLRSPIESYVIIGAVKVISFGCGVGLGWWLWS